MAKVPPTGLEALSPREREVLVPLAEGERVSDIARSMGLSVKTISHYKAGILEKLGTPTIAHLAVWAHDQGLTKVEA